MGFVSREEIGRYGQADYPAVEFGKVYMRDLPGKKGTGDYIREMAVIVAELEGGQRPFGSFVERGSFHIHDELGFAVVGIGMGEDAVYTAVCRPDGGYESVFAILRLEADEFSFGQGLMEVVNPAFDVGSHKRSPNLGPVRGKTTRQKRSYGLWALPIAAVFGLVLYVKAVWGHVAFFTQDSFSILSLTDDMIRFEPPNLEQYATGRPVNPWPLAYPSLLAYLRFGLRVAPDTAAYMLQGFIVLGLVWYSLRAQVNAAWLIVQASESSLWLLGHAWAEGLFVLGCLMTAYALEYRRKVGLSFAALLALHARMPGLPALLAGFLLLKRKGKVLVWLGVPVVSVVAYYIWNSFYTGNPTGGPREVIRHDWGHWFPATGKALLNELAWIRDTDNVFFLLVQIGLLTVLVLRTRIRRDSARLLVGMGIGYGVFTIGSHAVFRFAEDLDTRLLGPATVLVLAGLLSDIRLTRKQVLLLTGGLLVASLPFKALWQGESGHYAPTPYPLVVPAWAPAMPIPERNPLTVEGVELGRALFHDTRLSGSGKVSCAGCHQPKNAFGRHDPPHPGMRNTPSLLNVGWQQRLFWDGGVSDLESVSLAPLHSATEMGGNLVDVRTLLRTDGHYKRLMRKAFGTDTAQSWHILQALAQYQRTLVSRGAKVDKKDWKHTEQEVFGAQLFSENCARCHTPPFYTDFGYHAVYDVPGEPLWPLTTLRNGRYRVTQQLADLGAYKTPSLRNVTLTGPYMHDGGLGRLEDCLGHGTISVQALSEKYGADTNAIRTAFVRYMEALTDTLPSR